MNALGLLVAGALALMPVHVYAENNIATIKVGKVQAKNESNSFDHEGGRYGRYYTSTAEKDMQMITFDFTATSKKKNPTLPSLFVAKLKDGQISNIETPYVRFKGWSDYGCFIGLYHDDKNDFAKKDTVNFTAFFPIPRDSEEYIVFTDEASCYVRQNLERKRPPVSYEPLGLCTMKPPTSLDQRMKVLGRVRTAKPR